jgi:hypothetical protein
MNEKGTVKERFEALTAPPNEDGCRLWLGSTRGHGHGQFKVAGKLEYAHRFAWDQRNGPIPADHGVRNTCGQRLCMNPDHWRLEPKSQGLEERFLSRIEPQGDHLIWTGRLDREGYGVINDSDGRELRAQRVGYALWFGRTPPRRQIHHRCERRARAEKRARMKLEREAAKVFRALRSLPAKTPSPESAPTGAEL